jgi:hypothetical protein
MEVNCTEPFLSVRILLEKYASARLWQVFQACKAMSLPIVPFVNLLCLNYPSTLSYITILPLKN